MHLHYLLTCLVYLLSSTGDEDDDEQHRTDTKPAQVKRRQSVFSKLGSNRQKKVFFQHIPLYILRLTTYCILRYYAVVGAHIHKVAELLKFILAISCNTIFWTVQLYKVDLSPWRVSFMRFHGSRRVFLQSVALAIQLNV